MIASYSTESSTTPNSTSTEDFYEITAAYYPILEPEPIILPIWFKPLTQRQRAKRQFLEAKDQYRLDLARSKDYKRAKSIKTKRNKKAQRVKLHR